MDKSMDTPFLMKPTTDSDDYYSHKYDYGSVTSDTSRDEENEEAEEDEDTFEFRTAKWGVLCVLVLLGTASLKSMLEPSPRKSLVWQTSLLRNPKISSTKKREGAIPRYYRDQLVDHFTTESSTFASRYYTSRKYWDGPGSPIFLIVGGEDGIDEILYPHVEERLAKSLGAFVVQTEHRFYGESIPTGLERPPTNDELAALMSPEQALADYNRLMQHLKVKIGCPATNKTDPEYCPVITVGGSYPGFLSAMMRFVYPQTVDMALASSAPILLYSRQITDQWLYFDKITSVTEEASPGCASAYKRTLKEVHKILTRMPIRKAARKMGICRHSIPEYITTPDIFAHEITMMVGFANADFGMDYYPPLDPKTDTISACKAMQDSNLDPLHRMKKFFKVKAGSVGHSGAKCYSLLWDLPAGQNATITAADWTGVGEGETARSWEFQCCNDFVVNAGFSPESMFLTTPFDLGWLADHCRARFDIEIDPDSRRMVENFHFDDLAGHGASHIIFANGLHDPWSVFCQLENLSDSLVAVNMANGAHHTDINNARADDTPDVIDGRNRIESILKQWVMEIKLQQD